MVRFSLIVPGQRLDVDFTRLPDCAVPVRLKHMAREFNADTLEAVDEAYIERIEFGYSCCHKGKPLEEILIIEFS